MIPLFVVPSWQVYYDNHESNKEKFIKHLEKYEENNISLPTVKSSSTFITNPSIHVDPVYEDLVEFLLSAITHIKPEYNLASSLNLGMSSMFGTNTRPGGTYHNEMKADDFLTGVYFLNTPQKAGQLCLTHDVSDNAYHRKLYIENQNLINVETKRVPMPEGGVMFFPSYLETFTTPNLDTENRYLIHFTFKLI